MVVSAVLTCTLIPRGSFNTELKSLFMRGRLGGLNSLTGDCSCGRYCATPAGVCVSEYDRAATPSVTICNNKQRVEVSRILMKAPIYFFKYYSASLHKRGLCLLCRDLIIVKLAYKIRGRRTSSTYATGTGRHVMVTQHPIVSIFFSA
jgi:hypothetical protein